MKNGFVYVRESVIADGILNGNAQKQSEFVEKYCIENDIEIMGSISEKSDEPTEKRYGLYQALERVKSYNQHILANQLSEDDLIKYLVVLNRSRISTNKSEYEEISDQLYKVGARIYYIEDDPHKRAILFNRQCSENQTGNNWQQLEELRNYCTDRRIDIAYVFQEHSSAKTLDRPEWKKLMEYAIANQQNIDYLIITTWDRISQNATDALTAISELKKLQIEPIAIKQLRGFGTTQTEFLRTVYLSFPKLDNDTESTEDLTDDDQQKE